MGNPFSNNPFYLGGLFFGSFGNDNISGSKGNDLILGLFGDDTLRGKAGNDILIGGLGNDKLKGGKGEDYLIAGIGDDRANGGEDNDVIFGGIGNDRIRGDEGSDHLFGGIGNDLFIWNNGDGSDLVDGGVGFDTQRVNGADGAGDAFEVSISSGDVVFERTNLGQFQLDLTRVEELDINSLDGDDTVTINDGVIGSISLDLDGGDGTDTLVLEAVNGPVNVDLAAGVFGDNTVVDFENVSGSDDFGDQIFGDAGANLLAGNGGDDILNGRLGVDVLEGGAGEDTFLFDGDAFKGEDVSAAGRQIIGGEDFISDFEFDADQYAFNRDTFGLGEDVEVVFASIDANADDAVIPTGTNVIVLLNSDNDGDPDTPFLAGTAASQITELVQEDGAGFFVYFNSNLELNRVVYSENLNDATADLSIQSRQTDLTGDEAITALASFSEDNFAFVTDDFTFA